MSSLTVAELDALPVGSRVSDSTVEGALWIKYEDGTWHLIEQEGGWVAEGTDWSDPSGDTAATLANDWGAYLALVAP